MKRVVPLIGVVLVVVLLFLVIQNNHEEKDSIQTFRYSIPTDPPTLDWSKATDSVSIDVIENIMQGLIQYDENLQPAPAIAESWKVLDGGKRYVFNLRKDVKWTDGQLVRAQDFEYSWKRLLNPETAAEYAYFIFDVVGAEDYNTGKTKDASLVAVKALDDFTLEVKLRASASYFLHIPAFMVTYPLRKDVIEKYKDDWIKPENIVTCGAFKLKEVRYKDKIVLVSNPSYFEGEPKLQEVHALVIKSDHTAVDLYETGKLDILRRMPPLTIEKYKDHPSRVTLPFLRGYYYGFNITKKPFDDVRVRKAFAMAIDKKVFPELLKGGEVPVTSWVPPGMAGYEPDVGLKFNPAEARVLLAQAGYPNGKGLSEVTAYFDSRDDHKMIAEKLQQLWKQNLNVDVKLENQEWKVHLRQIHIDPPQMFRLGWGADFPDPDNFLRLFTSNSGNNNTRWGSPEYDRLVLGAAAEQDLTKRLKLYKKAQEILLEEGVAIVPLFVSSLNYLVKPHVKGLWMNSMERFILKKISLEKPS
ncbi:MAG TPA: peptide ABC transporter substrate-binding protein [Bdellovibrionota bacterium]|nr:peptide ABC transporter substrate-binding protein [Bdellovibrionota bacterium]